MRRPDQPDFLLIGAPKAGTTALHAALARHPDVFVTSPKEPKYWLCDDAPPPAWRGPGDAHSQREWIWRRADYEAAFRLLSGSMPAIDSILTDLVPLTIRNASAIYEMRRTDDGLLKSFEIRFAIDGDGILRLDAFCWRCCDAQPR